MRALAAAVGAALCLTLLAASGTAAGPEAVMVEIGGPIGPATSEYIAQGLEVAGERAAELFIVRIDTPGGLDTSMREIIGHILASRVPVAVYVAPAGARAASAGTYILYASHVAAMAPGTTVGAATPVAIGAAPGSPERDPAADDEGRERDRRPPAGPEKAVEDAVAYIRALAELRGRNAVWAERAVREAATAVASEAVEMGVADVLARDVPDLLARIDGRTVTVADVERTLRTADVTVVPVAPTWRTRLLAILTNPNVALILLMVGIYGLIFEFASPGFIGPGVIGALALLLGLYALHILPVNYAGLGLLLLGVALLVAEALSPSFGVLGIGGILAFVLGSIMLFRTDLPGFAVAWPLIGGLAIATAVFILTVVGMAFRARRRPVAIGPEHLVGAEGRIVEWADGAGRVRVEGETWNAAAEKPLAVDQPVRVTGRRGLVLTVEPKEGGTR